MMKTNLLVALICLIMGMSLPSLHAADKAAPKDTTVVIARGVSINADKALRSALRNAVQQVVGVIIDAETLIKNEKVVKDEILDFSNGFVETHKIIKEGKNEDGLYEITIKATVKHRQLIERLEKAKVYSAKVDGASLFGSVISEMDAQKKGAKFLEKALSDLNLPYSLLKAEVVNSKPKILKKLDTEIQAEWSIRVQFDMEKYQKVVLPKLKQVLGDIALEKYEHVLLQDPKREKKDSYGFDLFSGHNVVASDIFVNPFDRNLQYSTFGVSTPKRTGIKLYPIFLLEKWNQVTKQQWYLCYWVDVKSIKVFAELLYGKLGVESKSHPDASELTREIKVSLIGADKSPLFVGSVAWAIDHPGDNKDFYNKGDFIAQMPKLKGRYKDRTTWCLRPTLISAGPIWPGSRLTLKWLNEGKRQRDIYCYIAPFMNVVTDKDDKSPLGFIEKADIIWQPKIPLKVLKDVVGIEVEIQPSKAPKR